MPAEWITELYAISRSLYLKKRIYRREKGIVFWARFWVLPKVTDKPKYLGRHRSGTLPALCEWQYTSILFCVFGSSPGIFNSWLSPEQRRPIVQKCARQCSSVMQGRMDYICTVFLSQCTLWWQWIYAGPFPGLSIFVRRMRYQNCNDSCSLGEIILAWVTLTLSLCYNSV